MEDEVGGGGGERCCAGGWKWCVRRTRVPCGERCHMHLMGRADAYDV
jgi:hypothetical protein